MSSRKLFEVIERFISQFRSQSVEDVEHLTSRQTTCVIISLCYAHNLLHTQLKVAGLVCV